MTRLSRLEIKRLFDWMFSLRFFFSLAGVEHRESMRACARAMIQYGELLLIKSSTLTSCLRPLGEIEQTRRGREREKRSNIRPNEMRNAIWFLLLAGKRGKRNLCWSMNDWINKMTIKTNLSIGNISCCVFFSSLISLASRLQLNDNNIDQVVNIWSFI